MRGANGEEGGNEGNGGALGKEGESSDEGGLKGKSGGKQGRISGELLGGK